MTDWTMQSDVPDAQILSKRLGAFIRRQGSAKEVARRIGCDERTAKNIRLGRGWPIARHWWNIWIEFGDEVVEAVFYPDRVEARLKREAEQREQARRQRIASASLVEPRAFRVAARLGEGDGPDEEPADLGPPNLDLFDHHDRAPTG